MINTANQRGFTLLEVLLAVSITAWIGIGASQLLSSTTNTKNITDKRADQLKLIQKMDYWLKRDLFQVAGRKTKDVYGNTIDEVITEGDYLIEFTHSGWASVPGGLIDVKRSNMQRVAYAVRSHGSDYCKDAAADENNEQQGQCFVRLYWPVLDLASNSDPIIQVLLDSVESVQFSFRGQLLDRTNPSNTEKINEWQDSWPGPYYQANLDPDLAQIKVTITTKELNEVYRLYEVPRYAFIKQ